MPDVHYAAPFSDLRSALATRLQSLKGSNHVKALFFTHRQADPDALCAAWSTSRIASKILGEDSQGRQVLRPKVIAPQGASALGSKVANSLGFEFVQKVEMQEVEDASLVVILDAGEPALLHPYEGTIRALPSERVFIIDHHGASARSEHPPWGSLQNVFIFPDTTSTCEIVALTFPWHLDESTARALLVGLMFDSQHLGIATESTLEACLILVRAGAAVEGARELLKTRPDRSEMIARIKSAQRLRHEEVGKYHVLSAEVSSFHASVARMLLDIGADVGLAYGESDDGQARLSARSSHRFNRETNIDLGVELGKVASERGLVGGGHPTAASVSGKMNPALLAEAILRRLKTEIPRS